MIKKRFTVASLHDECPPLTRAHPATIRAPPQSVSPLTRASSDHTSLMRPYVPHYPHRLSRSLHPSLPASSVSPSLGYTLIECLALTRAHLVLPRTHPVLSSVSAASSWPSGCYHTWSNCRHHTWSNCRRITSRINSRVFYI